MIKAYVNYKLLFIFPQCLLKDFNNSDYSQVQRIEY